MVKRRMEDMREEERKLLAEIAECFFRDVYYPVTLCIYLRLDGSVSGVFQFDTLYCPAINS